MARESTKGRRRGRPRAAGDAGTCSQASQPGGTYSQRARVGGTAAGAWTNIGEAFQYIEQIEDYAGWPSPDDYDYSVVEAQTALQHIPAGVRGVEERLRAALAYFGLAKTNSVRTTRRT